MNRYKYVTVTLKWMGFKVSEESIKCIICIFVYIPTGQRDQSSHKLKQTAGTSPGAERWFSWNVGSVTDRYQLEDAESSSCKAAPKLKLQIQANKCGKLNGKAWSRERYIKRRQRNKQKEKWSHLIKWLTHYQWGIFENKGSMRHTPRTVLTVNIYRIWNITPMKNKKIKV